MAGPWEKFQNSPNPSAKPWERFSPTPVVSDARHPVGLPAGSDLPGVESPQETVSEIRNADTRGPIRSAFDATGIPQIPKAVIGAVSHPGLVARGAVDSLKDQTKDWATRAITGKKQTVGEQLETAPLIGSTVSTVKNQVRAGNLPGAVGTGLGSIATLAAVPAASKAIEMIPSTAKAGEAFSAIAKQAGAAGTQVPLSSVARPLIRLGELDDTGVTLPKAVRQLAKESGPIDYRKARDYASSISGLSAEEQMNLKPEMSRVLGDLRKGIHSDIGDAISPLGLRADYEDALKEYASGSKINNAKDFAKKHALKAGLGATAYGLYRETR